jgi:hypothetical protein
VELWSNIANAYRVRSAGNGIQFFQEAELEEMPVHPDEDFGRHWSRCRGTGCGAPLTAELATCEKCQARVCTCGRCACSPTAARRAKAKKAAKKPKTKQAKADIVPSAADEIPSGADEVPAGPNDPGSTP